MSLDSKPATRDELRDAIDDLLLQAFENGVDVADGAYSFRHDRPDIPDWEAHITRTEKPAPDE